MTTNDIKPKLLERLVRYTAIGTQSKAEKADQGIIPSSEVQWELAKLLVKELEDLGLKAELDEHCYVFARLPATEGCRQKKGFGLCAHMDTASDAPADTVKPQVHTDYDGKPIVLKDGFVIDPAHDADLAACIGDTIITSDGTTLLGADDKAGIAGIMTAVEFLLANPNIAHGPIEILFTPDEETGHGMDFVPLEKIQSKAFYTIDGGQEGEVEDECFNAYRSDIVFTGIAAHLGAARGKMVNAVTMAASFIESLPPQESPEATDGYYGFFCPLELEATAEKATLRVYIRDFGAIQERLKRIDTLAAAIEACYPNGKVSVTHTEQYRNMKTKLDTSPEILARLKEAVRRAGVEPKLKPIRGGTDGSRLTELGIPTPNLFTGGHNYHSRTEWASLNQMEKMCLSIIELAKIWAEE
ncbi:peptidase T [Treponema phagedenis]|uniref:Peptidase T n=2 Tax=Treponema phagedenis TaxID=162 RepID=A0A0B7GVF1_TREPH|nr:peptidase T [Treponema phagedenis]NVP23109.1 peptidase T [Treponema phagedenis]QEJ96463.1 peptidase T [Treponema phagedenis]QEJ98085.1 peptidase T [Treponema phagedenis]QEK00942.1 peptidase T [Treponema phagedenis]QEK03590.1 peptidase T [Treponema phagedenis]